MIARLWREWLPVELTATGTSGWSSSSGRLIVDNAGVLLTEVISVKPVAAHPFVIVDAAMNDPMRPTPLRRLACDRGSTPSGRLVMRQRRWPAADTLATPIATGPSDAAPADDTAPRSAHAATNDRIMRRRPTTASDHAAGHGDAVVKYRILSGRDSDRERCSTHDRRSDQRIAQLSALRQARFRSSSRCSGRRPGSANPTGRRSSGGLPEAAVSPGLASAQMASFEGVARAVRATLARHRRCGKDDIRVPRKRRAHPRSPTLRANS